MQVHGVQDEFQQRVDYLVRREVAGWKRSEISRNRLTPLYTFLAYLIMTGAIVAVARLEVVAVGTIGAIVVIMIRALGYGQQLQAAVATLQSSRPFLDILKRTIEEYKRDKAHVGTYDQPIVGAICATNLGYSYPDGTVALRNVSFDVRPGEVVGIVGPSGGGKTTLTQVVLGLRQPTSGDLVVDGIPVSSMDRRAWSRHVAVVPQDSRLLAGTIAENIRFFRSDLTNPAITNAAEAAGLGDFVEALPRGLRTFVGESGSSLSGGQRQRVIIARALARHPAILILDEPTSALDLAAAGLIHETIQRLRGATTILMIAHRLETIANCDRILVIEGGMITAFEQPAILLKRGGYFSQAVNRD